MAATANRKEFGRREAISAVTGVPYRSEAPRSPRARPAR